MNWICNIEYFIEICQISELPSIFNFVTSMMSFQLNIYYISWILRNYIVLGMNLTFVYHFFILLSLHFRLLSFYWSTTVIIEKQSCHLKELSTSLELRKGLFQINQSLITSLLKLAFSSKFILVYFLIAQPERKQGIHVSLSGNNPEEISVR